MPYFELDTGFSLFPRHNHNTRGANALHKNRCLRVFAQKSLKLNITNIVNDTHHIILDKIDTHSLNGFKLYGTVFIANISGYVYCTKLLYMFVLEYYKHKQIVKKKCMDCFSSNH